MARTRKEQFFHIIGTCTEVVMESKLISNVLMFGAGALTLGGIAAASGYHSMNDCEKLANCYLDNLKDDYEFEIDKLKDGVNDRDLAIINSVDGDVDDYIALRSMVSLSTTHTDDYNNYWKKEYLDSDAEKAKQLFNEWKNNEY